MKQIIVSLYGKGDFQDVQSAIDSIGKDNKEVVTIFIKEGRYKQKIMIDKPNVTLIGIGKVVLSYHLGANAIDETGKAIGTFRTASVTVSGYNFTAMNITFENTAGIGSIAGQALAVYIKADRVRFKNCRFLGYQDTIYTGNPTEIEVLHSGSDYEHRQYYEKCYIEGDVDFIFGNGTAVFLDCEIYSIDRHEEAGKCNGYITAASTNKDTKAGYVFMNCKLTSTCKPDTVYLGRPWRDYANVTLLQCELGVHIKKEGWHNWSQPEREKTVKYQEYCSSGAGGDITNRKSWSKQLSKSEIEEITIEKLLFGEDNWLATEWEASEVSKELKKV